MIRRPLLLGLGDGLGFVLEPTNLHWLIVNVRVPSGERGGAYRIVSQVVASDAVELPEGIVPKLTVESMRLSEHQEGVFPVALEALETKRVIVVGGDAVNIQVRMVNDGVGQGEVTLRVYAGPTGTKADTFVKEQKAMLGVLGGFDWFVNVGVIFDGVAEGADPLITVVATLPDGREVITGVGVPMNHKADARGYGGGGTEEQMARIAQRIAVALNGGQSIATVWQPGQSWGQVIAGAIDAAAHGAEITSVQQLAMGNAGVTDVPIEGVSIVGPQEGIPQSLTDAMAWYRHDEAVPGITGRYEVGDTLMGKMFQGMVQHLIGSTDANHDLAIANKVQDLTGIPAARILTRATQLVVLQNGEDVVLSGPPREKVPRCLLAGGALGILEFLQRRLCGVYQLFSEPSDLFVVSENLFRRLSRQANELDLFLDTHGRLPATGSGLG